MGAFGGPRGFFTAIKTEGKRRQAGGEFPTEGTMAHVIASAATGPTATPARPSAAPVSSSGGAGPTPARRRLNIPLNTAGRGSSGLQI
jgi:hypothetical protein